LLIPGLFDGEHAFQLELLSTAGCRLCHTERFSGLLVGVVGGSFLDAAREGFEEMNSAFKHGAEGKPYCHLLCFGSFSLAWFLTEDSKRCNTRKSESFFGQ
jgi:hypothetical protein